MEEGKEGKERGRKTCWRERGERYQSMLSLGSWVYEINTRPAGPHGKQWTEREDLWGGVRMIRMGHQDGPVG